MGESHLESTRPGLWLAADERAELRRRLQQLFDEYARRPPDPDGQKWFLHLGMHPEG